MKNFLFAFALLSLSAVAASEPSGDRSVNESLESEPAIRLPSVEAGVYYSTMKIERGQVENDEGVFGYEVELEWYGFFGGVEACYDLTNINGRRGRYNEVESFAGYGYRFGDLTVKAAYVYKHCIVEQMHTQEVQAELAYETPWVSPFVELECDIEDRPGALYGVFGLEREWELADWLALVVHGGIGFGNPYRNDACFESNRWAFREMHLGSALEIEVCPHMKLVPMIDFYDYFTAAQRRRYDKFNGFVAVAGCHLAFDF